MNKKEKDKLDIFHIDLIIYGTIFLVFMLAVFVLSIVNLQNTNLIIDTLQNSSVYKVNESESLIDYELAVKVIDKIKEDCGETHITKSYGNPDWQVFYVHIKDGWRKSEYIPLKDCIEVKNESK